MSEIIKAVFVCLFVLGCFWLAFKLELRWLARNDPQEGQDDE